VGLEQLRGLAENAPVEERGSLGAHRRDADVLRHGGRVPGEPGIRQAGGSAERF